MANQLKMEIGCETDFEVFALYGKGIEEGNGKFVLMELTYGEWPNDFEVEINLTVEQATSLRDLLTLAITAAPDGRKYFDNKPAMQFRLDRIDRMEKEKQSSANSSTDPQPEREPKP